MPIINVESSKYISGQQKYLSEHRLGQFSKFLNKNPIFVTYYVVNQAQSRTDAGMGAIYEEIGPNSPVRYNKVLELPTYNLPELKPDVVNDDGGYDVEMDITDITFLPGTVRPKPGDYMRIDIVGVKPLLYRCTNYRHNTIQSNDFYQGDFDLIDIKQEYLIAIENQVEQTFTCKFENIGTNNKVLLTADDLEKMNVSISLIDTLIEFYNGAFYNKDADGFILYEGNVFGTQCYCDNYLTRFINESEIFVDETSNNTMTLPYLDLLPFNFDYAYARTVWTAVLKRTKDYLNAYTFAWNQLLQRRTSPLMLASIPTIHPTLELSDHYMYSEEIPSKDLQNVVHSPGQRCGWDGVDTLVRPYFSLELVKSLRENVESSKLNVIEKMIFQYISSGIEAVTFRREDLLNFAFKQDLFTYMHMPIVIYILKQNLKMISSQNP